MGGDFLLIARMRAGDEAAVEIFVRAHYPAILHYCRLRVGEGAEDATQESFARFFASFDSYRHFGKARNYLYVIAGNVCRDLMRRRREFSLDALPEPIAPPTDPELCVDLNRAFDKLTPELREAALLYFAQGLKQREIASILGIGVPLVKYRIRKSREILARELRGED